ncbi:MAG: peptidoglycan-binding protein, partial [Sphingobacteriales bacterium]
MSTGLITPPVKKKVKQCVGVFETSSLTPRYGLVALLHDGPNKVQQVTYGAHQTAETGGLGDLLRMYCYGEPYKFGRYCKQLRPYIERIRTWKLAGDAEFVRLLKAAGNTCEVMQQCQEDFFDANYWRPAAQFFTVNGFILPLSMLVIYDSFIQSGGILSKLRERFAELVPAKGGDEKKWIAAYLAARDAFLEGSSNAAVRGSDYRTDCMLEQ